MTPEEITAMAKEAGFGNYAYEAASTFGRFAALVAEKAAAQEREACSLVCEEISIGTETLEGGEEALACRNAIRARGQKGGV